MKKENIFKQKLYQHTMPVREGLWDAIEAQLPPKKEQRIFPLFWLILFGTTVISGLLMLGIFNQDLSSDTHALSPVASSNQDALSSSVNTSRPSPPATEESTATTSEAIHSNTTPSASAYGISTENSSSSTVGNDLINTPVKRGNKTQLKPESDNYKIAPPAELEIGIKSTSSSQINQSAATHNRESAGTNDVHAADLHALDPAERSSHHFVTVPFLPQQELSVTTEESFLPALETFKPDPNCYKFSGTSNKLIYSLDVFAGPGFSPKIFEQRDSETNMYADARNATEKHQYGWSTGLRLNLQHRSGFTGRIGLSFTQAGDIFDYTDSLATQSTTRIDSFFAADGTFLYTETSQVLILGTLIKKIHNTYRYLDVPLIIGYEMPIGRATFLVNAGPVFNISSSHQGQILDPSLHPRSIKEGDPGAISVYKSNIGLSLYLGAGYLFPISNHFSGLIEPTFIYRLSPVTLASYPLQEHRHYAGLNLGIRYHIK